MCRTAAHDDSKIAASWPCASKRAVWQGARLIGQCCAFSPRRLNKQRRRRRRTDFLIGVDHDLIADPVRNRTRFQSLEGREHHCNAALHVSNAWSVQHSIIDPARILKGVVYPKDRVHVAGKDKLHRRCWPNAKVEMAAMLNSNLPTGGIDRFYARRSIEAEQTWERSKGINQEVCHLLKPSKVAGAAVDRGPAQHLIEHRLGLRAFDNRAFTRR